MKAVLPVETPLPQNVDAERALLDSVMLDPSTLPDVRAICSPDSLYIHEHRTIFRAMCDLANAGAPIDTVMLIDELERTSQLEDAGGGAAVGALGTNAPDIPHAVAYARIVQRCAVKRSQLTLAGTLAASALETDTEPAETAAEVRAALDALDARLPVAAPFHLMSIADILNQPRPPAPIEHFYTLNSTGIKVSPPGVGKTALLLDQMAHVALGRVWEGRAIHGGHVVYVCAEGQAFLPERLEALMLKLKVEDIPRLHILPVRIQLLEPRTVPGLLATFTKDLPEQPVWVAFDTVSQAAGGADENDANDMRDYVNALDRIREATGAFVDVIHHTGKDGSRGAHGSSVLHGNFDTVIQITDTDGVAVMKCEKQRGGWAPFKPFSYRVKSLALDEDAMRTGPVIEACEPPVKSVMPASYIKTLDALAACPGSTAAYGTWLAAAKIPASTFNRHRHYLLDYEYVHRDPVSDVYRLTTKGAALLPRYSHGIPMGATG